MNTSGRKTGFVFNELYLWHDTGNYAGTLPAGLQVQPGEHYEHAETKRRLKNLLEVSGLSEQLTPISPVTATVEQLCLVHTEKYVNKIRQLSAQFGGDAGEGSRFGTGSFEIAALAAGGVIQATKFVWENQVDNAYALIRPPGHHAEKDHGRGFCLFGNISIAATWLQQQYGIARMAVVDWDVHHGNGTQDAFYNDPSCLTLSIHQDGLYPRNTGSVKEQGSGPGEGANLNIPLPPGCGNGAYIQAFEKIVIPALEKFRPDIIFLACGFDACVNDPLGRMMVTSSGFRTMTKLLMDAADSLCSGRLVVAHEGGYSLSYVPYCGLAVLEQLSGINTDIPDLNAVKRDNIPGQNIQAHQRALIDSIIPLLDRIPGKSRLK